VTGAVDASGKGLQGLEHWRQPMLALHKACDKSGMMDGVMSRLPDHPEYTVEERA